MLKQLVQSARRTSRVYVRHLPVHSRVESGQLDSVAHLRTRSGSSPV
jgi:hypothetical protein